MATTLVLSRSWRRARCGDVEVDLGAAPVLFALLTSIARGDGAEARRTLFERVWEQAYRPPASDNTLRVNITRLRHALAEMPFRIAVTPLGGYQLEPPVSVEEASHVAPAFAAQNADPELLAIAEALDGEPGALGEAARLLPLYGAAELLRRVLDGRLPGVEVACERRWEALGPIRTALSALQGFDAPFDGVTAAEVCGGPEAVLALMDAGVLLDVPGTPPLFRLPRPLRAWVRRRHPPDVATWTRYAEHVLRAADAHHQGVEEPEVAGHLDWLTAQRPAIEAIFDRAEHEGRLDLLVRAALALFPAMVLRAEPRLSGLFRLDRALAASKDHAELAQLRVTMLHARSQVLRLQGHFEAANTDLEEAWAARAAVSTGRASRIARSLGQLWRADRERSASWLTIALELAVQAHDAVAQARCHEQWGLNLIDWGEVGGDWARSAAADHLTRARAGFTRAGDLRSEARILANLGHLALSTGDFIQAEAYSAIAANTLDTHRDRHGAAVARANLGAARRRLGRPKDAVPALREAAEQLAETAIAEAIRLELAAALWELGEATEAWSLLDEVLGERLLRDATQEVLEVRRQLGPPDGSTLAAALRALRLIDM